MTVFLMKKHGFFIPVFVFVIFFQASNAFASGGDTIKIISYNTLNYGLPSTDDCPGLLTFKKHKYLREILEYTRPDILGLIKMTATPVTFTTDTIPDKILDSVCYHCYDHTPFTNISHYTKENMLYFRKDKIGYLSTKYIYSDVGTSDINHYKLYYKSKDLAVTHDTQFINIILVHLESGGSNSDIRATELGAVMKYLQQNNSTLNNFIIMGDFNSKSSHEKGYQSVLFPNNDKFRFYDPVYNSSDWKKNPEDYAMYLTQSTREEVLSDCGAAKGMYLVFDHILLSNSLVNEKNSVKYLKGSCKVIGQDGKHINISLNDAPTNMAAPKYIINDLYFMSTHLPVEIKLLMSSK